MMRSTNFKTRKHEIIEVFDLTYSSDSDYDSDCVIIGETRNKVSEDEGSRTPDKTNTERKIIKIEKKNKNINKNTKTNIDQTTQSEMSTPKKKVTNRKQDEELDCTSNSQRQQKFTKRMADASEDMDQKKRRTGGDESQSKNMNLEHENTKAYASSLKKDASNKLTSTDQDPSESKANSICNITNIDTETLAATTKRIHCIKGRCLMDLNESQDPTNKFKCKTNQPSYKHDDSSVDDSCSSSTDPRDIEVEKYQAQMIAYDRNLRMAMNNSIDTFTTETMLNQEEKLGDELERVQLQQIIEASQHEEQKSKNARETWVMDQRRSKRSKSSKKEMTTTSRAKYLK